MLVKVEESIYRTRNRGTSGRNGVQGGSRADAQEGGADVQGHMRYTRPPPRAERRGIGTIS